MAYALLLATGRYPFFHVGRGDAKLFDKFWLLAVGFLERLGNVLDGEGLAYIFCKSKLGRFSNCCRILVSQLLALH